MKLNIAYLGSQKFIEIDDEKKLRCVYDKRISQEVAVDDLGEEYAGYVFRISGGNDKEGFCMVQGVLSQGRVRLLLNKNSKNYCPTVKGIRRRKSVRGCIVAGNLSVLNLVLVKKGAGEIPGLTDVSVPRRLGPKRASKIRKLFNLTKDDDVRKFVIRRKFDGKNGKAVTKAPKIQRLITPVNLQRKRRLRAGKIAQRLKVQRETAEFKRLYAQRVKEQKERRASEVAKRRSSRRSSRKAEE